MSNLTHKQEAFAQAIVSGKTQADAYRAAYDARKMSDNAIYREASLLLDRPKLAQRVADLRKEIAQRQLWTREMSVKALIKAYKVADERGSSSAMTIAVRELNNMHGYNEPTCFDYRSSDGSMLPYMTIDALEVARKRALALIEKESEDEK